MDRDDYLMKKAPTWQGDLVAKQVPVLLTALAETTQMLRDAVPTYHRPVEMQARIQANGALLAMMGAGDE